jgi:hypothetical protein
MDRRPLLALSIAAMGVVATVTPSEARACTCIQSDADGSYRAAAAVFEGQWVSGDSDSATFRLLRIWKGLDDDPRVVEVTLGEHFVACSGFPRSDLVAEPGVPHVVYAAAERDALLLGACGRYFPSERDPSELEGLDAHAVARIIDSPVEPAPSDEPEDRGAPESEPPIVPPPSSPAPAARGCSVGSPTAPRISILLGLIALVRPWRRCRGRRARRRD